MKNKLTIIFIFCCLILAGSVLAKNIELAPTITDIKVRGASLVNSKDIMAVVFSRVGDNILEEKIKGDLKAIYAMGFFSDVNVTFEAKNNGSMVVFLVKENPIVNQIVFSGNSIYGTAELNAVIKTQTGYMLNFNTMRDDIETINDLYKSNGYTMARVTDVDTDNDTGIITFKIVEGKVEAIQLEGNEQTLDYVILREMKTKAGSVYNEDVFKKDLRKVFNLGFFSEVNPIFEPGTSPDLVVIKLKITETRSSTINFGGGYGEREGWFGFTDLSINNLFGTGQGVLIRGQSGQQLSTYQLRYTNPWFWPEKLGANHSLTLRRWYTIGQDFYLTNQDGIYNGADASLSKPLFDNFSIAYTLGSEYVKPYGAGTFEAYQSDTIGATLSYDTRDFWLNPKDGKYITLGVKQGWKFTTNTSSFFKLVGDYNVFRSVITNNILAFHLGAGSGFGDIPLGEEFWAGGANTVRGYYVSEAKHGTRRLIMNAEYRLDFSDLFQGVFFYDWGNAWNNGAPDAAAFLAGWGPGVRVTTPMGPIRLDYGVPVNKTFSEGIMHFSIGQAF